MTPHSSTLAWKIPWTEEPGGLQSVGSRRVGHAWATSLSLYTFMHWRRKWQPTPAFLPGESQGRGSLVGCRLWGRTESDTTEVMQQQQGQTQRRLVCASLFLNFSHLFSQISPEFLTKQTQSKLISTSANVQWAHGTVVGGGRVVYPAPTGHGSSVQPMASFWIPIQPNRNIKSSLDAGIMLFCWLKYISECLLSSEWS